MWFAPELPAVPALQVLARFGGALCAEWRSLALALPLFALAWFSLHRPLKRAHRWALVTLALIGAGVAWSLHLGWIADDAFISFRYARNGAEGVGLVFNEGERVEGYTNFLWTVLLAGFHALGLPLPAVSVVLTSCCLALTIWVTARFANQLENSLRGASGTRWHFPIAAACLALNYTFASFGTSGLETMLGTLLVLLAVERAEHGAALSSGTLAIGATLAHPDHAIFYACLALTFAHERRFRELFRFALPFLGLYVPYFAWRWSYYGDFFPNTYYAKNADQAYFTQGLRYLALSGWSSGLWAALPLAVYAIRRSSHLRIARFCALAGPAFLFYVAKIGGDFMLGRLICPLLPLAFILAELGVRRLARHERPKLLSRSSLGLAALCTATVPIRVIRPNEVYAQVADERTFYPIGSYFPFALDSSYRDWAHAFNRTFRNLSRKPTVAMYSVGIMGYETRLKIIDNAGLNHRGVAHWRNRHRGRPGHEKIISPGLLVQSDADLSDVPVYPAPYGALGRVNVDGVRFHTVKYDPRLFSELALAGVRTPPLLRYIEEYVPAAEVERLECDLWYMREVYFRHHPDSSLRLPLLRKLVKARPEWADLAALLLPTPSAERADWRPVHTLDFDTLEPRSQLSGDAFQHNPMAREAVGQPPMAGTRGRFINTFQDENGDQATGHFSSAPFRVAGDLITLQVGGGHDPRHTYAELLVGAERRFLATGCNSTILGQRTWRTGELRGRLAVLRVVDTQRREFGHIIVDDLVQWAPSGRAGAR